VIDVGLMISHQHKFFLEKGTIMTDRNILEQKIEIGGIKGQVEDLFKGDGNDNGFQNGSRIVAGLDEMLGKRADIASRVVAS
jgi:hypothetical protein